MYKIKQLTKEDISTVIDFVYHLSIDNSTASYSRMKTRVDVERELVRRVEDTNSNVFSVYIEKRLVGVCAFYWLEEDNYIQTTVFVFSEPTEEALSVGIDLIKQKKENYRLLIGVPAENKRLSELLDQLGEKIEYSANLMYDKNEVEGSINSDIVEVNANNFNTYREYHDRFALKHDMYWNADNLQKAINQFKIFNYLSRGEIIASIFYKCGSIHQEIFGLFSDVNDKDVYKRLLNKVLMQVESESEKIAITFFVDMKEKLELSAAIEVGFRVQETYHCFEL